MSQSVRSSKGMFALLTITGFVSVAPWLLLLYPPNKRIVPQKTVEALYVE